MRIHLRYLLLPLLGFATVHSVWGQQRGSTYDRILLPIAIRGEVPGALGSRWTTRVAIVTTGTQDVDILGYQWAPDGCVFLCAEPPLTTAGLTFQPSVDPGQSTQGAILRVDPSHAADVSIALRIQDVSRQSETWGTEIPIVRERDLLQRPFQLLDIPLTAGFRGMLRLYDVDARQSSTVRLRFYGFNPAIRTPFSPLGPAPLLDSLLLDRVITLQVERRPGTPLFDLGYAQLSLGDIAELQGSERIRIEVTPITQGLRLWGFVSITNNATQHVTIVSP
jgi:hypothetical protein